MVLKNGNCFLENGVFEQKNITINDSKISKLSYNLSEDDDNVIDLSGYRVLPGLIDIHTHGCVEFDFCDNDYSGYEKMCSYYNKNGITTVLGTSVSLPLASLKERFTQINTFMKSEQNTAIKGINMEGPFFDVRKKGAHDERYIVPLDAMFFKELQEASENNILMLDLAPEKDGAIEFIAQMKDKIVLSLAHTTANYDIATKAFAAGSNHVTHLYNAMPPYSHREPGIVGAVYDNEEVYAELVCDGIHIHPVVIRATFKQLGEDRVVLISDSMRACGVGEGTFTLGGLSVNVKDRKATLQNGTIAGSVTNLFECMKQAINFGVPVNQAIKAATINPAKSIGIDSLYGSISVGKFANLVVVDDEYNIHKVILGEYNKTIG